MSQILLLGSISHATLAELYCPGIDDLNQEYGATHVDPSLWALSGNSRISSKTSWNLLDGFIEFDMNNTGVAAEINAAMYLSSPSHPNCGLMCYCDINQGPCMEMDIVESNANCAMAATWHTQVDDEQNCGRGGCQAIASLPGDEVFHIKAEFATDGAMTVHLNGCPVDSYNIVPSDVAKQTVAATMRSVGAVIEYSLWSGWVPNRLTCARGGDLTTSRTEVYNVQVSGQVVQGPEPTRCSSDPSPPSPFPPCPPPAPGPSAGTCCWGGCNADCHDDTWCDQSSETCSGCGGSWCPFNSSFAALI